MKFTFDPEKRCSNLKKHGLDFVEAKRVFSGFTLTRSDTRFPYSEERFSTIGLLDGTVVVIAHTETDAEIRIISMRKAEREMDNLDEAPVWTEEDFKHAIHRVGLRPVGKKVKINITLDPDIVAWYKNRAGGRGYQTLINATLREAMRGMDIADTLRRVIREETGRI